MSNHGFVLIEHPCRLSVDLGRIKLERHDHDPVFLLPSDLDVVCIDHPIVSITTAVLKELAAAGVSLLVTDDSHMPTAMMTSLEHAYSKPTRSYAQWTFSQSDVAEKVWKVIVQSRIRSEANTLRLLGLKGALHLERLAKKVTVGDKQNCEAQAARHYWKHLFGSDYRRTKLRPATPDGASVAFFLITDKQYGMTREFFGFKDGKSRPQNPVQIQLF